MDSNETIFHMTFSQSHEKRDVPLAVLRDDIVDFLEHFGEESLVGEDFYEIIREGGGETRFARLLKAVGCDNDPKDFFSELTRQLAHAAIIGNRS